MLTIAAFGFNGASGFHHDDARDIQTNPAAKAETFAAHLATTNRPLTKASYALHDSLHGDWAAGYWIGNLALHLIATGLVFTLFWRAFPLSGLPRDQVLPWAFAATALWAVHPALSETVSYLSGRSMGLSAALMLAALVLTTAHRPRGWLACLCAALAVVARETALVLPLVLLWWQMTLQPVEPPRAAARRFLPVLAGTLLGAALILAMPRHRDLIVFSLEMRGPLLALRDNLHAATEILGFWVLPGAISLAPAPPPPQAWDAPGTLARIGFFCGIGILALTLRRAAPLFAFGLGLAVLALVPSNSILWRLDPVALKPLYLAGLGITMAAAGAAVAVAGVRPLRLAFAPMVLALMVSFTLKAQERARLFTDAVALWGDAAAKSPDFARAQIGYAVALFNAGRLDEARQHAQRAADLDPADPRGQALLDLVDQASGTGGA